MAGKASAAFGMFWRWWTGELKALLPRAGGNGRGRAARRLVIAVDGPRRTLLLEKGAHIEPLGAADDADAGLASLADLARSRPGLPVGLRFGGMDCFSRMIQLPAQAEGDFARILDLDMERTTPLRTADVLTAFYVVPDIGIPR